MCHQLVFNAIITCNSVSTRERERKRERANATSQCDAMRGSQRRTSIKIIFIISLCSLHTLLVRFRWRNDVWHFRSVRGNNTSHRFASSGRFKYKQQQKQWRRKSHRKWKSQFQLFGFFFFSFISLYLSTHFTLRAYHSLSRSLYWTPENSTAVNPILIPTLGMRLYLISLCSQLVAISYRMRPNWI